MATSVVTPPFSDAKAIHTYLADYFGDNIHLVSIKPDGTASDVRGQWFGADASRAEQWAVLENGRGWNVYTTVNICRPGVNTKPKGGKADPTNLGDMVGHRFIHVDLDPPKDGSPWSIEAVLKKLAALRYPPSFVIFTGGGLAAFWRLDEVVVDKRTVTNVNRALAQLLGGDDCHNHDRLMRLVGTVNIPNAIKRQRGRTEALAYILREDDGVVYPLHALAAEYQFVEGPAGGDRGTIDVGPFVLITPDDLGLGQFSGLRSMIEHPRGSDRSRDAYACAGAMQREGFEPEQILGILLNPKNAVSEHILQQRDPRYQAMRCIEGTSLPAGVIPMSAAEPAAKAEQGTQMTISATSYRWRDPETIPPRPWLYGRWLLRASTTAVIAAGGIGKSTFVAGTALALVTSQRLHGKTIWGGNKRVWIWNLEDSTDELARSIQAAAKLFGLSEGDLGDRLFVDAALDGKGLCIASAIGNEVKIIEPVVDAIIAELKSLKIDVLVIDPFVSCHEVDENSNTHIDKVAKTWSRVAMAADCAIVLVHHTSKAGSGEVTAMSGRGAVAMINACRSALVFNRMTKDEAVKLGVDEDENWRFFTVHDDKHNRAPATKADWFNLASVDLGNGIDEDRPSDSLGVAQPWSPPSPFETVPSDGLMRVQKAVAGRKCREHHLSPDWFGNVVADVLGLHVDRKAEKARIQQMQRIWIENGVFKVVEGQDERRKPVKFVEVDRWANDTSAPPRPTGAEQTGATTPTGCSTTTRPLTGRGGGAGGAGKENQVEQSGGWRTTRPLGGEAFRGDAPAAGAFVRDLSKTRF